MKSYSVVTIQMKATEQHFPFVLFIMLCKMALTFESVDEILQCCDYSNESYRAALSCGTVYMLYKVVLTFKSVNKILQCGNANECSCAVFFCGAVCCAARAGSNLRVCR